MKADFSKEEVKLLIKGLQSLFVHTRTMNEIQNIYTLLLKTEKIKNELDKTS